jgi:hypothetical protein
VKDLEQAVFLKKVFILKETNVSIVWQDFVGRYSVPIATMLYITVTLKELLW